MDDKTFLIVGANGQLGTALKQKYPNAKAVDKNELDISDRKSVENFDWSNIKVILNAAAYTNVAGAETPEGRILAQKVNDEAVANLAEVATKHDLILVHISTDYIFDGTKSPHAEDEHPNPLNVYGQTKAGGDKYVIKLPKHYLIRTSWVIGEGKNFVRVMLELGRKNINPTVISDQIGRLTFTHELVRAIDHLLVTKAPYGTYNVSNGGQPASWAEITRQIFKEAAYKNSVSDTTTIEYFKGKPDGARRPLNSVFNLSKIESTGFKPRNWQDDLAEYISKEIKK